MPTIQKIAKVRLLPQDLVPIIQRRGNEQDVQVAGPYSHYAYDQAKLHLLAEDLFNMLARVVREARRTKASTPGTGLSDALLDEASALLEQVTHGS
ncbi:MAG TPA: hypothetical protein VFA15_06620 [Nitrososphaera sp.]|nr:hypothetical protein [Nitrososphaera sp.]